MAQGKRIQFFSFVWDKLYGKCPVRGGILVKNAASIQKIVRSYCIKSLFIRSALSSLDMNKLLPYSLINKRIRGDGQVHHLLLRELMRNKGKVTQ